MNTLHGTCRFLLFHVLLPALLCAVVLTSAGQAWAAEPVGWVQEVAGRVTIQSGGASAPATVGKGVAPKDRIITARASRVQIMFKDKTTLALSAMSECQVGDVYLDPKDRKNARFNLNIFKGIFGFLAGGIAKENPEGFRVESPEVAVGVRGTEFASAVEKGQEVHGLYEGGPVVVTALNFKKKSAGALSGAKKQELCEAIEDTVKAMERAYRSKWGAGDHTEARQFEAQAEEYEKLLTKYQCD